MVNRSLACLRRMLRIAHEDGRIQNVPKIRFLKEPPARRGFLELEKFDELVNLMPTHLSATRHLPLLLRRPDRGGAANRMVTSRS